MAHLAKFGKSGLGQILAHVRRGTEPTRDKDGNVVVKRKYKNQNIVDTTSKYNYNLRERGDGITDYAYIERRVTEYNVLKRSDVNWLGSWVTSLPKSLENSSLEDKKKFFQSTYDFLCKRYGVDNVVYAYVHLDETTPHMHTGITPCYYDEKKDKKVTNFKQFFPRKDFQTFHKDYSDYMEKVFGYDIGVFDRTERKKAYNKEITELIKEGNKWAKQVEEVKSTLKDKEDELEKLKKTVSIEQENALEMKNIADFQQQKALKAKRDLDSALEEKRKLEEENRFLREQWDNASPLEKMGVKNLKIEEDKIKREVDNRVYQRTKELESKNVEYYKENNALRQENKNLKSNYQQIKREHDIKATELKSVREDYELLKDETKKVFRYINDRQPGLLERAIKNTHALVKYMFKSFIDSFNDRFNHNQFNERDKDDFELIDEDWEL